MTLPIVRPKHPSATGMLPKMIEIMNSGRVTNGGPFVQDFEKALTHLLDCPTLVFSSGMAALIAMLRAAEVQGDEVICPSLTFPATPHAIVMAGAKPVFCDIDETLTLDSYQAAKLMTHNTAAIMPVDPYGTLWDDTQVMGFDVPVLIDAAPSFGSHFVNSDRMKRGEAQIFSFHATKPFSTTEGGALCSYNEGLMRRAAEIRNFGLRGEDCFLPGFNGKMNEICAMIGLKQLEDWQHRASDRIDSARRLRNRLNEERIEGLRVQGNPAGQEGIWLYQPIFIEPEFGKSRDQVVRELNVHGVQTRTYYPACHKLTCYNKGQSLPVTERVASQVISLPVYDGMREDEIGQIVEALRKIRG
jgi:dTDP-4-amino-4,6-dideoxygalactose transaminase